MKFGIAVKGIIRKDGKILVIRRTCDDCYRPDTWETVGGSMDANEVPQDALRREIMEETCLEVEVREPFNVFNLKREGIIFKIGITFICDWKAGDVILSEEHTEYKWIDPEEFAKLKSAPSLHREINDYAKKYNER
ncbi:MAG: Mutator MutT related protein [uncultured bacterium]|nr:MAG: Mutator MutT related protein [uncultured bacterium]